MPGYIVVLALDLLLSALGRRVLVLFVVRRRRRGAQQKMIAHRFAGLEFA
jgi:hypothetical protein